MHIYSICIYKGEFAFDKSTKFDLVKAEKNLDPIRFFARGSFKEFIDFVNELVMKKTQTNQSSRVSEKHEQYDITLDCLNMSNHYCCIMTDSEYDQKVITKLAKHILTTYINTGDIDIKNVMSKSKTLYEFDPLSKMQKDLDGIKQTLYDTMDSLLERGQKMDDLVKKSEMLSASSKQFYVMARKTNSCCTLM